MPFFYDMGLVGIYNNVTMQKQDYYNEFFESFGEADVKIS